MANIFQFGHRMVVITMRIKEFGNGNALIFSEPQKTYTHKPL